MSTPSKTTTAFTSMAVGLTIAAVFCVYLAILTTGLDMQGTDWAMYVMHAGNILHGRAYADTPYVFQPEANFEGPSTYPTGFSLLLVPFYAVFGMNVKVFKIVSDAVLALSLLPIYFVCRRLLSVWSALLVIVATAFGWEYMQAENGIGSDGLYQLLSFAAIALLLWVYDRGKDTDRGWMWGILCGATIAAAYLSRSIGLALIVAVVLSDMIRRRKLSVFLIAVIVTFGAVFLINNSLFHKDSSVKDEFVLSVGMFVRHAAAYVVGLSQVFTNPVSNTFRHLAWLPFLLLAGVGIWTGLRKSGPTFVEFYWAVLLAVLSLYWMVTTRYLLPVLPIFLCYALVGAEVLIERIPAQYRLGLRWAGAVALLLAPAFNLARIHTFQHESLAETPMFQELCDQIQSKTGARDYFMFWNPRVLALYTNRPSSAFPLEDAERLQRYVDRIHPNYVVLDKHWDDDRRLLAPFLDGQPQQYVAVFENKRFKLLRAAAAPPPSPAVPVP